MNDEEAAALKQQLIEKRADPPIVLPPRQSLWTALLEAQRHADAITKTGRNTSQGWEFVTVEQVTRVAREALNAAGLIAVLRLPTGGGYDPAALAATLVVVHPASGQEAVFPVPWPVERAGPQARRAAYAYARKQALLELLALSEPDPETDAGKPQKRASKPATVQLGARGQDAPETRETPPPAPPRPDVGLITPGQLGKLQTQLTELDKLDGKRTTAPERREFIGTLISRELASAKDLTHAEARDVIEALDKLIKDRMGAGDGPGDGA